MTQQNIPVYKMVNGQRVRIPNDQHDPARRYSRVADVINGVYDLGFTDEQEKQRDEEEARWEAEAPQREEEKKGKKK